MCGLSSGHSFPIRVLASECLGEIGAIDPARMGSFVRTEHAIGIKSDDDLAIELIVDHLAKASEWPT